MRILGKWGMAATLVCCGLLFLACANNDNNNLSKHARGLAIDINTLYNPYIKTLDDGTLLIQPATAKAYCDRSWDFPYKIDHEDLCFRLFTEAGFEWGGDWTTRKDYVTTIAIHGSHGILTVSAIGISLRMSLRTRLTPG